MSEKGISAAILYPVPIHLQPAYADDPPLHLPVTEKFAGELLCLPIYPELSEGEVNVVCDEVRNCTKKIGDY